MGSHYAVLCTSIGTATNDLQWHRHWTQRSIAGFISRRKAELKFLRRHWSPLIRRPTVGGLMFYHEFFLLSFFLSLFLSYFSPRHLISKLAERNLTKIGHMFVSKCNFKTPVQNLGYPLPLQTGAKNQLFGRIYNLTAILTAYIFRTKHDIDNRSNALTTTRGLLHRPKMSWTLVHKRLQTGPPF